MSFTLFNNALRGSDHQTAKNAVIDQLGSLAQQVKNLHLGATSISKKNQRHAFSDMLDKYSQQLQTIRDNLVNNTLTMPAHSVDAFGLVDDANTQSAQKKLAKARYQQLQSTEKAVTKLYNSLMTEYKMVSSGRPADLNDDSTSLVLQGIKSVTNQLMHFLRVLTDLVKQGVGAKISPSTYHSSAQRSAAGQFGSVFATFDSVDKSAVPADEVTAANAGLELQSHTVYQGL